MGTTIRSIAAFVLLVLFPGSVSSEIYKWIDENGTVQYGAMPPANASNKTQVSGHTTPKPNPKILALLRGTSWRCVRNQQVINFYLYSDGSYRDWSIGNQTASDLNDEGRWELQGSTIEFLHLGGKRAVTMLGKKTKSHVLSIDEKSLTLLYDDETKIVYEKLE